ncbi:hypothetical protein [Croceicoccus sp. BE223]|uniref:hypothetical protein n=1 Tax=Croceicoccus sp. BE223 TaxID=2817716 RepID=UPI00285CD9BA|nr:hypothetical protein [Croceicoccus sp. BE223]MDR7100917.1 hypothetical protein [Croceicoccus sp. BE223]
MTEWFRQTEWNAAREADFLAQLGRARRKGQYLNIQAYSLLTVRPDVAAKLCRMVLDLDEPDEHARAGLYLGTALALGGDADAAIAALEGAIEAERRNPSMRTAAYIDQALLIALTSRSDLYDIALDRLCARHDPGDPEDVPSVLIAAALIGGERGEDVTRLALAARAALDAGDWAEAGLPPWLDPAAIAARLAPLAG